MLLSFLGSTGGNYFCLRPSVKDQGITWVAVVAVLLHLSHFLYKSYLSKKFFPARNQTGGSSAHQSRILSTELQRHCYTKHGKVSIWVNNFKNHTADLGPALALVSSSSIVCYFFWRFMFSDGIQNKPWWVVVKGYSFALRQWRQKVNSFTRIGWFVLQFY